MIKISTYFNVKVVSYIVLNKSVLFLFCTSLYIYTNSSVYANVPQKQIENNKTAISWANLTLELMKTTPGGSPTYGSRFLGYVGMTMFECVSYSNQSVKLNLEGLSNYKPYKLKRPRGKVSWEIALNAGQASIIKNLYGFTSEENLEKITELEREILASSSKGLSKKIIDRSIIYGRSVAENIYEWSKSDGGHNAYLRNFDNTYINSSDNGKWNPPTVGQAEVALPLHTTWGNNRTFSKENNSLEIPEMISFDYKNDTEYFKMMKEVYDTRMTLSQSQKEIANWWGDDPSETFSPPGHSYYMALVAVQKSNSDLFKTSETFAAVGMAVADAFINCWKCKYHYNAERPFNFIYHNMSTLWSLYWPEPPFPAFYSGHAGQASSAATVLEKRFGEKFEFTDMSHVGRPIDKIRLVEYKPRKFNSFWEAAEESAMSRLYGGIHTRQDNEVGLKEGKKIGANINSLFI